MKILSAAALLLLTILTGKDASASHLAPRRSFVHPMKTSVVSSSSSTASITSTYDASHASLTIPRGGAGPLDPELTGKIVLAAVGVQGLANCALTETMMESYGIPKDNAVAQLLWRIFGVHLLKIFTTLGLTLFGDANLSTMETLGYASAMGAVAFLQTALVTDSAGKDASGIFVSAVKHAGRLIALAKC